MFSFPSRGIKNIDGDSVSAPLSRLYLDENPGSDNEIMSCSHDIYTIESWIVNMNYEVCFEVWTTFQGVEAFL